MSLTLRVGSTAPTFSHGVPDAIRNQTIGYSKLAVKPRTKPRCQSPHADAVDGFLSPSEPFAVLLP